MNQHMKRYENKCRYQRCKNLSIFTSAETFLIRRIDRSEERFSVVAFRRARTATISSAEPNCGLFSPPATVDFFPFLPFFFFSGAGVACIHKYSIKVMISSMVAGISFKHTLTKFCTRIGKYRPEDSRKMQTQANHEAVSGLLSSPWPLPSTAFLVEPSSIIIECFTPGPVSTDVIERTLSVREPISFSGSTLNCAEISSSPSVLLLLFTTKCASKSCIVCLQQSSSNLAALGTFVEDILRAANAAGKSYSKTNKKKFKAIVAYHFLTGVSILPQNLKIPPPSHSQHLHRMLRCRVV